MIEKEAKSIMGGTAYETESERIRRVAREEMQAELDEKEKILEEKDRIIAELEGIIRSAQH